MGDLVTAYVNDGIESITRCWSMIPGTSRACQNLVRAESPLYRSSERDVRYVFVQNDNAAER